MHGDDPDESGAEQIALGDKFYEEGDLLGAADHYRAALAIGRPADEMPEVTVMLGMVLERIGHEDEAERLLRQAADTDSPSAPYALLNLGAMAEKQGRSHDAERLYRAVIDTADGEIVGTAMQYLGSLMHRQGRMSDAEHAYRDALAAVGPSKGTKELLTLARIEMARGSRAEAEDLYLTLLDQPLTDERQSAFSELALLFEEQGRGDEMEQLLRAKAASSDEGLARQASWELLQLLMRRRDAAAAEGALDELGENLDADQAGEVRVEIGIQLAAERRPEDAAVRFRQVVDHGTPQRAAQARLMLGKLLAAEGSLADSEELLQEVATSEWEPYNAEAMVNLAGAAVWRGEFTVAKDWLEKAMRLGIDDLLPQVLLSLGGVLAVEDNLEEAESYIKRAMESEFCGVPEQAAAALQLGIVWRRLGLDDKASEMLSIAIRRARLALERMDAAHDSRRWVPGTGTQAMAEVIEQAEALLADH